MPLTEVSGFPSPLLIRMKPPGKVSFICVYYASVTDQFLHMHVISSCTALTSEYQYWRCFQISFLVSVLMSGH